MDTTAMVTASAIVTRSIIKELKDRGWLPSGILTLVASFVINTIIAFGWSVLDGATPSVSLARGLGSMVLSALYNDISESVKS